MLSVHRCPLCKRQYLTARGRFELQPDDAQWMDRIAFMVRECWPDDSPEQIAGRIHRLSDGFEGLGPTRVFALIEVAIATELDLRARERGM